MGKVTKADREKMVVKDAEATAPDSPSFNDEVLTFFRKELDIDIIAEYRRLKRVGKIPADKLTDRMELIGFLNTAAEEVRATNLIYLKARTVREHFRIDFDRTMRDLNRRATEKVSAWLETSGTKKQITIDMVKQEIASDPELSQEYTALVSRQEELRTIRDDCALLLKEWADRKWTLRAQADLVKAEREVKLPSREES